MNKIFVLIFTGALFFTACQPQPKRIACIGDSITNGGGLGVEAFYPTQLDVMLGDDYAVLNCGESGATMQSNGNKPYWKEKDLSNVFVFQPEIITIMLGTNDSKNFVWDAENYEQSYQRMIDTLQTLPTQPKIYLCLPPPAYSAAWEINDSTIRAGVIPIINRLAEKNKLPVIDVYEGMSNKSDLFPDGIHPNNAGKKIMAEIIAQAIQNK